MVYEPEAGDIIWTDFDPSRGREQGGRRPAVVLTSKDFFLMTRFLIVCPITSKVRPFGSSAVLPIGLAIQGEILTNHIRSLDMQDRPFTFSGTRVPLETLTELREKLCALVGVAN